MIYCPRCGRPAHATHKFCTGCGLHLLTIVQALADDAKELERRTKALRHGLQQVFSGIGLALFFYFFFGHSLGFAAIGVMFAFIGLGQILSAMLFASPALHPKWRVPSLPRMERKLSPHLEESITRDLPEPPLSVPEPMTLPLDPAKGGERSGEGA